MTPTTMALTLPRVFRLGGWMPRAHVTSRVATGVVAWLESVDVSRLEEEDYLEHLNEGNREMDVCHVTEHQTQTEEDANGNDGS
jgi:hypothetical protein